MRQGVYYKEEILSVDLIVSENDANLSAMNLLSDFLSMALNFSHICSEITLL